MSSSEEPRMFAPVIAQYPGENFVIGGGVAIFHLATGRVVICSAVDRRGTTYYFLPKGRRDAGEESGAGAEREGYEEVCHL
jgi:8-oxo-dGTP pyrophosphatase MutT (NUDIX family)